MESHAWHHAISSLRSPSRVQGESHALRKDSTVKMGLVTYAYPTAYLSCFQFWVIRNEVLSTFADRFLCEHKLHFPWINRSDISGKCEEYTSTCKKLPSWLPKQLCHSAFTSAGHKRLGIVRVFLKALTLLMTVPWYFTTVLSALPYCDLGYWILVPCLFAARISSFKLFAYFKFGLFVSYYRVLRILFMSWKQISITCVFQKYLLQVSGLFFQNHQYLSKSRGFKFWWSPIYQSFPFCGYGFGVLHNLCPDKAAKIFFYVFF